jgi:hypothetical protein
MLIFEELLRTVFVQYGILYLILTNTMHIFTVVMKGYPGVMEALIGAMEALTGSALA